MLSEVDVGVAVDVAEDIASRRDASIGRNTFHPKIFAS